MFLWLRREWLPQMVRSEIDSAELVAGLIPHLWRGTNSNLESSNDRNKPSTAQSRKRVPHNAVWVIWILVIRYCPSTSLRMVSQSNHFVFRARIYTFYQEAPHTLLWGASSKPCPLGGDSLLVSYGESPRARRRSASLRSASRFTSSSVRKTCSNALFASLLE